MLLSNFSGIDTPVAIHTGVINCEHPVESLIILKFKRQLLSDIIPLHIVAIHLKENFDGIVTLFFELSLNLNKSSRNLCTSGGQMLCTVRKEAIASGIA